MEPNFSTHANKDRKGNRNVFDKRDNDLELKSTQNPMHETATDILWLTDLIEVRMDLALPGKILMKSSWLGSTLTNRVSHHHQSVCRVNILSNPWRESNCSGRPDHCIYRDREECMRKYSSYEEHGAKLKDSAVPRREEMGDVETRIHGT